MIEMILWVLGVIWVTWIYYVLVMGLKTTWDQHDALGFPLPIAIKVLAYPQLLVLWVMDVAFNIVIGSLFFLEPPKEWLFTARLSRWNDTEGWRGKMARFFCRVILDPADHDGRHCS